MNYIVYFKNGDYRGRKKYSNSDHVSPMTNYEVYEIAEELYKSPYQLALVNDVVVVDEVKKKEKDDKDKEMVRIEKKINRQEVLTQEELLWYELNKRS